MADTGPPSPLSDPSFASRWGTFDAPGARAAEEAAGVVKKGGEKQLESIKNIEKAEETYEKDTAGTREKLKTHLESPRPPVPDETPPPKPPDAAAYRQYAQKYLGSVSALAALGGVFVRHRANAALKAYTAAVNGWMEGNSEAYAEASKQWEQENRRMLEINRQRMEHYRHIIEDRNQTTEEMMDRLRVAAMERRDKIMYDAAVNKKYELAGQAYDLSASLTKKSEDASKTYVDNLREQMEQNRAVADQVREQMATPEGQAAFKSLPGGVQLQIKGLIQQFASKVPTSTTEGTKPLAPEPGRGDISVEPPPGTPMDTSTTPLPTPTPAPTATSPPTPTPAPGSPEGAPGWKSPLPEPARAPPGYREGWTWEHIDRQAAMLNRTGPQGIRAMAGAPPEVRSAITQRAAEMAQAQGKTPGQVVAEQAGVKGSVAALAVLEKQEAAVDSYGRNMLKNGDQLLDLAKKVNKTGIPVLQRWVNAGKVAVKGDADVAEFDLQLRLWIPELARTAVNPNLTGVLTEGARKEFESVIPSGATVQQFERLIKRAHIDFENRRDTIRMEKRMVEHDIAGDTGDTGTETDDGWTITETPTKH